MSDSTKRQGNDLTPPLMDALEPRRLLSASLSKGTLTVNGTSANDSISVERDRPHGKYLVVNVNGVTTAFKAKSVKSLVMLGGAGNDTIMVSDANGTVPGKHVEVGGDGNDTLEGDTGNDTLIGGVGDDSLDGSGGNDSLEGDAGNDTLVGDGGNDSLDGGDGVDDEVGGAGSNVFKSDAQDHLDSTGGSHDKFENEHGAPDGGSGSSGTGSSGTGSGGGDDGGDNGAKGDAVMGLKSNNDILSR